jgi:hypothetical protein
LIHERGERVHVRFFGVAFDRVALAGDGHGKGPFQDFTVYSPPPQNVNVRRFRLTATGARG